MEAVLTFLLEKETMAGRQFADCMEGKEIGEARETTLFDAVEQKPAEPAEYPTEPPADNK